MSRDVSLLTIHTSHVTLTVLKVQKTIPSSLSDHIGVSQQALVLSRSHAASISRTRVNTGSICGIQLGGPKSVGKLIPAACVASVLRSMYYCNANRMF
jgi:hypothetical protein